MMKKRLLALLMAAVMTISLLPTTAWAHDAAHAEGIRDTEGVEDVQGSEGDRDLEEVSDSENVPGEDAVDAAALAAVEDDGPAALAAATTLDSYFEGLPVIAETEPGSPSSTKKWKVTTLGGDTVLMSGNKGKSSSTSTLQLTFTGDTHLTFEYKVSSEKNYDKCTITLGSDKLVNGESGDQNWKPLELDAKSGQVLTVVYTKDSGSDRFDDCVYLRNFSAGEALVVTFHANNGTEDTKGDPLRKEAYALLKKAGDEGRLNFVGNVEGSMVPLGACDVAVCDGFTGNVQLKTIEGVAKFMSKEIKGVFMASVGTKLGYLLCKKGMDDFREVFNQDKIGGAPFLGIAKPVIKAHGSSNEIAVMNAVRQAIAYTKSGMIDAVKENIQYMTVSE